MDIITALLLTITVIGNAPSGAKVYLECNDNTKFVTSYNNNFMVKWDKRECNNGDIVRWTIPSDPTYTINQCIVYNNKCDMRNIK